MLMICLDKLVTCADENGFKFSPTKTLCVHFCKKNGLQPEPDLKLYGQQLPVEEQVKFLGLFFDKKLNFTPHIKYMKDKCRKALQLLRVISSKDWGGDRTTLLRIYRSHIRSKLDYGCIVYGSARRSYLAVLDLIANQGLRLCSGAYRTSPIKSLQVETGEPSLETRRLKLSLQYYMKMKANPENPAYLCVVRRIIAMFWILCIFVRFFLIISITSCALMSHCSISYSVYLLPFHLCFRLGNFSGVSRDSLVTV